MINHLLGSFVLNIILLFCHAFSVTKVKRKFIVQHLLWRETVREMILGTLSVYKSDLNDTYCIQYYAGSENISLLK